jgi:flagellar motor switch protein FliN/FliY
MAQGGPAVQDRAPRLDLPKVDDPSQRLPGNLPSAPGADLSATGADLSAVHDIAVKVSVVLGTADLPVRQLLRLGRGAVIELNRKIGEDVEIYVNDRLVARGEVVSLGDRLGVTMTEICKSDLVS